MTDDLGDLTDPEPWTHRDIPLGIDPERIYRHAITIGGHRRRRRRRRRRQRYLVGAAALALAAALPILGALTLPGNQPAVRAIGAAGQVPGLNAPTSPHDQANSVDAKTLAALKAHNSFATGRSFATTPGCRPSY